MTYEELLKEITSADDRFVVMTAENRAAIRNLPAILGSKFIDTGIMEQTLIGAAAGLALCGRIPVVHALAAFLTLRAFEFIRTDIGIAKLPVKLVGGVPGFLSEANGPTHQALEDVSLMRGIPGMNVFCPSDEEDMILGLRKILKTPDPFYIRYNNMPAVVEHSREFQIGKAEIVSEGSEVTILVYGFLFNQAWEARRILESQGFSTRLINLRTVKPVDEQAILSAASDSELIVTLEDHFLTGGLYSIVSELLIKNQIMANVHPISMENRWFKPGLLNDVLEYEGFTGRQIAEKIVTKLNHIVKTEY